MKSFQESASAALVEKTVVQLKNSEEVRNNPRIQA